MLVIIILEKTKTKKKIFFTDDLFVAYMFVYTNTGQCVLKCICFFCLFSEFANTTLTWVGLNTEKDRKGPKRTEKDRKGTEKDRKGTEKDRKGRTSLLFTEMEAKIRR